MKYLGIDYGDRWIGFAIGDDETMLALPFKTIFCERPLEFFPACKKIVQEMGIDKIIVGVPMIGADVTKQKEKTLQFVQKLSQEISCSVDVYDESFSSREAQRRLQESGKGGDDHAVAAMLILQGYLDKNNHKT